MGEKAGLRNNKILKSLDKWVGNFLIIGCYLWDRLRLRRGENHAGLYKNILLVKLAAVGDTVLLIPAIRAMRRKFPQARICMLGTKINYDIIENCPYLDEVILFEPQRCLKNPLLFFSFVQGLRERGFDLYLDFEQWARITPLLGYLSRITKRVGFASADDGVRSLLYTDRLSQDPTQHEVERFLELLGLIGEGVENDKLELWVPTSTKRKVESIFEQCGLKEDELIIAIHPGCGRDNHPKNWDKAKYVELCNYLIDKHNLRIIITGGTIEFGLAEWIAHRIKREAVVLAGRTSLDELIEVIRACELLVCGNTGVMHIAAAVETPAIVLHGPTNPVKWGPRGKDDVVIRRELPCSPCHFLGFEYACEDFRCMRLIEVEEVQEAVEQQLIRITGRKPQTLAAID